MSEYLPDLITRLRLDTTEMEQGASRSAAIGGAIGGAVGVALAAGLGKAAGAVKDFVSGSVGAFSELEDTTAAAGVIFGDSMGAIIAQSQSAAGALGLSSQQVIGAANTFGTYGKAAGLAGGDLAKFSTDMTGLAGDLASFKGTSPEQAIEAIGAALRGEAEPIRAYGVLLDDASLKARALAMGIADGTSALTPQQKALAAQAEILAQTSDAQGDFARTSESTANTQKRLAAEAENVQAKFGTLLAPAFTAVRNVGIDMLGSLSGKLDEWIPKVETFYSRTSDVLGGLRALFADGDITGGLLSGLGVEEDSPLIDFLLTIRDTVSTVIAAVGPSLSAIGAQIGAAFTTLMPALAPLIPAVLQLFAAFSPVHLILSAIMPVLPQIAAAISQVVGAVVELLPVVLEVAGVLVGALIGAITALLPAVLQLLPVIGTLVQALGPVLGRIIEALAPIIVMLVEAIVQLLPPLLAIIDPVLSIVLALLPLVDIVAQLITTLLPPLIDVFVALITPILTLVSSLIGALLPAIDALLPVIEMLVDVIGTVLLALLPVVSYILGSVIGAFSTLITWFVNVTVAAVKWVAGVATSIGSFVSAVSSGIGRAVQWFRDLPGLILGALGGLVGTITRFGRDTIQGFIDGIVGMAGRVISAIRNTITDALPDFVKKALGIASPSRLLRGYGRNVGEGFALGIDDMVGRVAGSAADMADAVSGVTVAPPTLGSSSSAFIYAAAANPAGGAGANGGNAVVPQVRVYIGNEEITDRVRVEVIDVLTDEATAIAAGSAD